MPRPPHLSRAIACATALFISGTAFASTILVDQSGGGGAAFTDIPPAIAAAQPHDVILVSPGSYSGFTLSMDLVVLGAGPNVTVGSGTRIHALPAGERIVLANLNLSDLRINNCTGTVVLDGLRVYADAPNAFPDHLTVSTCTDVRAIHCTFGAATFFSHDRGAVSVVASRMELVQCTVNGDAGTSTMCGIGQPGRPGVSAANAARLHVSSTSSRGGNGGAAQYTCPELCNGGAGDGGAGVEVTGGSQVFAMGRVTHILKGGMAGDGQDCPCDGSPGIGLVVGASTANWSGCLPEGGAQFCFGLGQATLAYSGGVILQAPQRAPFLERSATPAPGQALQFTVGGVPGDVVELRLGRGPALNPIPGVQIEELTTVLRVFQMGTLGASGETSLAILPPGTLPRGFDFYAQAVVSRGGQEMRTNSVPVVLR